uniref:UTP14C small subunit processome component n=1 Tax=Latimeria chalumnae TaxID=7897 RepID=H3B347_LATCH
NSNLLKPVQDEEEEELFKTEYTLSASEEEAESDEERKHHRLLEAISSLDGKKRRKLVERTEASVQVSEFSVSSEGAGEKIELSELLGKIGPPSSSLTTVKKQLSKLKQKKTTLELPLSRQENEKIQRAAAYENTSKTIGKWDQVVLQNRRAEQLVFPLNAEPLTVKPVEEVVTGWKARTPLEQEIFNLLHKNKQPVTDPLLTPTEEASFKAMSLEEAKLRRAELQKARALQSYLEAKARRERKIKSKKYHKVLKKVKKKEALKEFEEMRRTNPEAALEELNRLERSRLEERMSLRHQNSGKWAKSKAIMAKYDQEARKAMQEQLEKNKELTKKLPVPSDSEEEEAEDPEVDVPIPDFVNEAGVDSTCTNPWMLGRLTTDDKATEAEEGDMEPAALKDAGNASEEEEEISEDEALLKEFDEKRRLRKLQEEESLAVDGKETEDEVGEEEVTEFNDLFQKLVEKKPASRKAKTPGDQTKETAEQEVPGCLELEEEPMLDEQLDRRQTLEELEELGRVEREEEMKTLAGGSRPGADKSQDPGEESEYKSGKNKKKTIDPKNVLMVKSKVIKIPSVPTAIEGEDEEEDQRMIIKEAFAADNVIDDFLKEKRRQVEAEKPKKIDLTLPGWGEWGGVGLKPSAKKRRRFLIKAPPAAPRKDQSLPNVIINEKRDVSVTAHQVNELPFPFDNRQQFERSIRVPVGNTWNTQRAVQKLTAPRVITRLGTVIGPITEEDASLETKAAKSTKPAIELNPHKSRNQYSGTLKSNEVI